MATSRPARPARAIEQDGLADALGQVAFVTMAVLSKMGADNDLSLTQLRVLGILRDRRQRMAPRIPGSRRNRFTGRQRGCPGRQWGPDPRSHRQGHHRGAGHRRLRFRE